MMLCDEVIDAIETINAIEVIDAIEMDRPPIANEIGTLIDDGPMQVSTICEWIETGRHGLVRFVS
jgi:hypothetical protein